MNAFVMRNKPSKVNRIDESLANSEIIIGWSHTGDKLLKDGLDKDDFKRIIKDTGSSYYDNNRVLGYATGCMWRFISEMNVGDYVIIPAIKSFYICRVESDIVYYPDKIEEDTAIRRTVSFLNSGEVISKEYADSALRSRLKYQGTIVGASDLIGSIEETLIRARDKRKPDFKTDLRKQLVESTYNELTAKTAYMDDIDFEHLIADMLDSMGGVSRVLAKNSYKGIADCDVVSDFENLGISICTQIKYHINNYDTGVHAVKQLVEAISQMDDTSNNIIGWVITAGTFNEDAKEFANTQSIRIIEGYELAEMLVDSGVLK